MPKYKVGQTGIIHGLQNAPEYNGTIIVLIKYYPDRERWQASQNDKKMDVLFRPQNIHILEPGQTCVIHNWPEDQEQYNNMAVRLEKYNPEDAVWEVSHDFLGNIISLPILVRADQLKPK